MEKYIQVFEAVREGTFKYSGVPRNFVRAGSTNSVEGRGQ